MQLNHWLAEGSADEIILEVQSKILDFSETEVKPAMYSCNYQLVNRILERSSKISHPTLP